MMCEANKVKCGGRGGVDINNVICSRFLFSPLEQVRLSVMDFMTSSYFLREQSCYHLIDEDTETPRSKNIGFSGTTDDISMSAKAQTSPKPLLMIQPPYKLSFPQP